MPKRAVMLLRDARSRSAVTINHVRRNTQDCAYLSAVLRGGPRSTDRSARRFFAHLPRRKILHEPHEATCHCGCARERIGEVVAEKLGYVPGAFTVEQQVRGKCVCTKCETLVQAPVPAQVIDKGIPTGLIAQALVAKYANHQPHYRQNESLRVQVSRSPARRRRSGGTPGEQLAPIVEAMKRDRVIRSVLHADETPVIELSIELT